jgi:hypothetical protein
MHKNGAENSWTQQKTAREAAAIAHMWNAHTDTGMSGEQRIAIDVSFGTSFSRTQKTARNQANMEYGAAAEKTS